MSAYAKAGAMLSLSAHYHPGQPLSEVDGVRYWTCPALCESPFRYGLIHLDGTDTRVESRALRLPEVPRVRDVHAHTHYAYCSEDVTAREVIRRARTFGVAGQCLTEHADQLYLTEQEHASGLVFTDPDYWRRHLPPGAERMPSYRREMEPLRDDYVKLGMEIELDLEGRPAICSAAKKGWDVVLGAVHWIPEDLENHSRGEINRAYMQNAMALLECGVDVLAHPFRFFRRHQLAAPPDLYEPLAEALARSDTAAEINFHTNQPDPEFFALCIQKGVRIAFGSDSHRLSEVGDFHPHLELIRKAAGRREVSDLLFDRPWRTEWPRAHRH
jgi:histidinol phosphatase-like PHP family hydrolase